MPPITLNPALSTDATINFANSAGYTFDSGKTEFTAGLCRLKNSVGEDSDIVTTPEINWGGRDQISRIAITATEAVGYRHRFILSFDGGLTWMIRREGGWLPQAFADVSTAGMPVDVVQGEHLWPDTSSLIIAFQHERDSGGGDGSIDQITIGYGDHEVDLLPEVTATEDLPFEPVWPINWEFRDYTHRVTYADGTQKLIRRASTPRLYYPKLRWSGLNSTDRDTLFDFLMAQRIEGFLWTPVMEGAEASFVPISEPNYVALSVDVWAVECDIMRTKP